MAGAGDVETKDPEADGHQPRAGEVLAALMQTQYEGSPRDDPTITKKTGAPGRQSHHKTPTMQNPNPPPKPEPCRPQKIIKLYPVGVDFGEFLGAGGDSCQKARGAGSINKDRVVEIALVEDIKSHDKLASRKLFDRDVVPEARA